MDDYIKCPLCGGSGLKVELVKLTEYSSNICDCCKGSGNITEFLHQPLSVGNSSTFNELGANLYTKSPEKMETHKFTKVLP